MTNWSVLRDSLVEMDPPAPVLTRLRRLVQYYEALGFEAFDAFVNETVGDDGVRIYNSLWIFNGVATMEAVVDEGAGTQMDGAPLRSHLQRWEIRSWNYDFRAATPESKLTVQLWYSDNLWGELHATASNCDRLTQLLKKYVIPETAAALAEPAPA